MAAIHAAAFVQGEQWSAAAFDTLLSQPGVVGLIDPDGGFILGRAAADEGEILTLAVLPALRRQGRARALLREAENRLRAAGATTLFLEVTEGNVAARSLYDSAGYRQAGRRPRYYPDGGDALVLRVNLMRGAAASG